MVALQQSVTSGNSSVVIARQQYGAGLVIYVNVLSAEQNLLSAQNQRAQSRQALATDLVTLYKALGDGWS